MTKTIKIEDVDYGYIKYTIELEDYETRKYEEILEKYKRKLALYRYPDEDLFDEDIEEYNDTLIKARFELIHFLDEHKIIE